MQGPRTPGEKRDTAESRRRRGIEEENVEIRGEGCGSWVCRRAVRKSGGVPRSHTRRAKSRNVREREGDTACSTAVSQEEVVSSLGRQVHSGWLWVAAGHVREIKSHKKHVPYLWNPLRSSYAQ